MCETICAPSVSQLSSAVPDHDAYVGKSPPVDLSEGLSIPSDLVRLQEAIGGDEVLLNPLLKSRRMSFLTFYRPKIGSERN